MEKQITRTAPHQSFKVIAAVYFVLSLPFAIIGLLAALFSHSAPNQPQFPVMFFIFAPILYAVIGYIFFAFFCWIYNLIANRIGGIQFEVIETNN